MLCELKDAKVLNFESDRDYHPGCPTCDYGSAYIDKCSIETTNYLVEIEVNQMYEFPLTLDFWVKFFCQNVERFKNMSEEEFLEFLKVRVAMEENEPHDCYVSMVVNGEPRLQSSIYRDDEED